MRRSQLALALAVALAVTACAGARQRVLGPSEEERRDYAAAISAARKDPAQGRARLAEFVTRHPGSALADDAVVWLARFEREAGRADEAERWLRQVLAEHPKGDRSDAARLELARLLAARGERGEAARVAEKVQVSLLRESERRVAYELLADLARDRGDTAARLEWLSRQRAAARDDAARAAIDREIEASIAPLSADELMRAADRLDRRPPAAQLWFRAADLAMRGGDASSASRALAEAERLPLSPAEAQQLARLQSLRESRRTGALAAGPPPPLGQIPPPELADPAASATGAIGVVLPLSGPFARVADDVLRGVLLAADVFGANAAAGGGLRLITRDSAGRPEQAAAAVRELGLRGDVSAIVGPLTRDEVEAAGQAALEVGLPLLALTRHEEVARGRAEVLCFGLTRRMEAEVLAEHAVYRLGLGRFAILYPKDEYGREFESLLWQAVEARGGRVVAVAGYAPSAAEFSGPIRSLLGPGALRHDEAGTDPAADARMPPPLLDFDAIFLPDAADKVGLIANQLAEQRVAGVQLLGPSGWHHPELLRTAGAHVEGAFFSTGFDPSHPSPLVQGFAQRYREAYGQEPSPFAAQGFDATNLLALQLLQGAAAPADVRNGLLATDLYPGVSGVTSIGFEGSARKRPFLVEVRDGTMVSLEP